MSRRTLAVMALALAASSLAACSDSITAPVRKSLTPSAEPDYGPAHSSLCKGGWVSSTGRC